jgi:Fe-S-cluster containining protein
MCARADDTSAGSSFFNARTKCCTYHPALPSFLVGGILAGEETAASRALQSAIESGAGVTPFGVAPPRTYGLLYRSAPAAFGHSLSMRCPYYDEGGGGRCGIWEQRPTVCATWYCKHERGALGLAFWTSLEVLLDEVERSMARWCLLQLDPGPEAVARLLLTRRGPYSGEVIGPGDIDRTCDEADRKKVWGRFAGREREYFLEAARLVGRLGVADIRRICGTSLAALERLTVSSFQELRRKRLPARLRLGSHQASVVDANCCRVISYSLFDPLEVPLALLDLLPLFDGRRTTTGVRRLLAARGYRVSTATLRALFDVGVLEDADAAASLTRASRP